MIVELVLTIFGCLILLYIVYWLGKRYAGWDLKKSLMKRLGLYEEPVGLHEDRIQQKVKQYQSFKDNLLLFFVLPLQIVVIVLWFLTGGNLLVVVLPGIVLVPLVAVLWMGIMFVYTKKYTKKTALEVTIHETLTRRFSDHWGIETPERLNPNDPRIAEAKAIIEIALQLGRGDSTNPSNTKSTSAPSSNLKTSTPKPPSTPPGEDFIYLVKKAFCDVDDPWYQTLVYSDVPWEHHMNPLTTTTHIGKIPVDMPCSKVSFTQVSTIMELPFLMFVESKNIIERVKNREQPLMDNPVQRQTTKTTYDGLLSVVSAGIIEVQQEEITELKALIEQYKTSAGYTAAQMLDYQTRMGQQKPPPPKVFTPGVVRFLKYALIATVIVVLLFISVQTAIFWLNYNAALSVPPPEEILGVWGRQVFQTLLPGSPSHSVAPPHPFYNATGVIP